MRNSSGKLKINKLRMNQVFIFSLLVIFGLSSCNPDIKDPDEKPIARVNNLFLFPSDVQDLLTPGLPARDSIEIIRRLTEEWIMNKLLLKQAETYLPESLKDIEKQVEKYRSSLLIYQYKQNLLSQNLDTVISRDEIEAYYSENSSNYILNSDLLRISFIKVSNSAPQISNVRIWYKSSREDYLQKLEEYCKEYAENYSIKGQKWISLNDLLPLAPLNIDNPSRYLDYNKNIETSDEMYHYFIHIDERKKEGETSPIEMVYSNIRSVIMNKRKVEYIQDLENTVYQEGFSRNQVEIY
jgi:hypothetical protein